MLALSNLEKNVNMQRNIIKSSSSVSLSHPDTELSNETIFLSLERQKVGRKINQTKRSIATSEAKEMEKLESALADLRVDLNYILVTWHGNWLSQPLMTVLALS